MLSHALTEGKKNDVFVFVKCAFIHFSTPEKFADMRCRLPFIACVLVDTVY